MFIAWSYVDDESNVVRALDFEAVGQRKKQVVEECNEVVEFLCR